MEYSIIYEAENHYENMVKNAVWQFLIIPAENETQELLSMDFRNSLDQEADYSENSLGFRTIRIRPGMPFTSIKFSASFQVFKKKVNPFAFDLPKDPSDDYKLLQSTDFKVDFDMFLRSTGLCSLADTFKPDFQWDRKKGVFENLCSLNQWVYEFLEFKAGVTQVDTALEEVLASRQGVCQDFTHFFLALCRKFGVPARYTSGYLHQGNGYFGDSQMHAWAEAFVPAAGWIGFDPTNNLLVSHNHIKVAHGRDYTDCAPLKGILYTAGSHNTTHSVAVSSQQ